MVIKNEKKIEMMNKYSKSFKKNSFHQISSFSCKSNLKCNKPKILNYTGVPLTIHTLQRKLSEFMIKKKKKKTRNRYKAFNIQ